MSNFAGGYPPQQQQQPQNNSVMVVTVRGEVGARFYPVAAGNTVLLIDFDAKKFWLKSTDFTGMPSRFTTFNFTEEVKQPVDSGNFISRTEFNELKQTIDSQFKQLLDVMKGGDKNVKSVNEQPTNVTSTAGQFRPELSA